ncbi:hypothetical protein ACFLSU_01405 [Bacteroidota bacterium]
MKLNYILIVLIHIVLFCFSLVPFYVEGDDASTVIHHVLGGDLQPVYSMYHGMFDKYLNLFGNHEVVLRKVAIFTSFFASLLSLLLLSYLMKLKNLKISQFSFLICFVIVEFLFWALIINPTAIAFVFILLSHIFLLKFQKSESKIFLLISILFFGLGVSFRWSIGFYLFVLYAEYVFVNDVKVIFNKQNFIKSLYIFPLYLLSVLLFIYLSGYTPLDIYTTYTSGASYLENKEVSYLSLFATSITFTTPALLFFFILAVYWGIKERKIKLLLILVFSLLPYLFLGFYPSLKYMITIVPPLFFLILDTEQFYSIKNLRIVVLLLIFVPFCIGIRVNSNSAWGPGFKIKTRSNEVNYENKNNFNPDKSTKTKNISSVFIGGGCAMPTPEGPRPFWGFGSVLFKDWKVLITDLDTERGDAISYALDRNYNILQDVKHSFIATKLLEQNFKSSEPFNHLVNEVYERTFFKQEDIIKIKVFNDKNKLFDKEYLKKNLEEHHFVLYVTYTNIISKLSHSPDIDFEQKGAYWGVVKLK